MKENPYLPTKKSLGTSPPLPRPIKTPWNGWWTLLWAVVIFFAWQFVVMIGIIVAAFHRGLFDNMNNSGTVDSDLLALALDGDIAGTVAFISIFFVCPLCWMVGKIRPNYTGWGYLGQRPGQMVAVAILGCPHHCLLSPFWTLSPPCLESMVQTNPW